MPLPASLQDVVDLMLCQSAEADAFINCRTGEVTTVTEEERSIAEGSDGPFGLSDWMHEAAPRIRAVLESDDWLQLPSSFDIHEYRIMQRFCEDGPGDEETRQWLRDAIRGSGAFRRFRSGVERAGLLQQWYDYRDAAVAEIAAEWLDEHAIPYTRDLRASA